MAAGLDSFSRSGATATENPEPRSEPPNTEKMVPERYTWIQFLEDQFLQATQTDGAKLTKSMKAMAQTFSSNSSSIYGARPFLSVIPSVYFKMAFCGLAILYASLTYVAFCSG